MHILFYYFGGDLDYGWLSICLEPFSFYDWLLNNLVSCICKGTTSGDFSQARLFKLLDEFNNCDLTILVFL